ncbi:YybH family protein [Microvirga lotononidis]|uniref:Ketosteroid isomerase-like enzyme n=1 Tax=Microvirga lotononidis TaxID=864069 RepID=I4YVM9_9HYPH|nr:nuclear transport factor 2 family protein [Microvirga lotononidis]EIM28021.1 ketosteroid isomerase-like enzyme [Microvirga lotononidis]WQO27866.1 nuclear transport factor 2 family protein [Microvirga lotononidis]
MKLAPAVALVLTLAEISTAASGDLPALPTARPEKLREQWQRAFAAGDSGALAGMYWPDADLLPPGGEKKTGAADIKKFWEEQTAKFAKPTVGTSKVVVVSPNFMVETGLLNFEHKTPAATGPRKAFIGHYVVVWRRIKNNWKIAVDTWNSSEFTQATLP